MNSFDHAAERIIASISSLRSLDLPEEAVDQARHCFLDTIGTILGGAGVVAADERLSSLFSLQPTGPCPVPGTGLRTDFLSATFCNAAASHLLGFNDTNFEIIGHPSVTLVSTILAASGVRDFSGDQAIRAFICGFETMIAIARTVNPGHYEKGWHTSSTIGIFGAAVASAYLLELEPELIPNALGFAASFASGLRVNFGTSAGAIQLAHAARGGVQAALLARAGLDASVRAFTGPQGFLGLHATSGNRGEAFDLLATHFALLRSGVSVKMYPCCAASHGVIDTLLELRSLHRLTGPEIRKVVVRLHPLARKVLSHDSPRTVAESKFSVPFCVAVALRTGQATLSSFSEAMLGDPETRRLMSVVEIQTDAGLATGESDYQSCELELSLGDGRALRQRSGPIRGSQNSPPSWAELARKFRGCCPAGFSTEAERIVARVLDLRNCPSVRELAESLLAPGN